ncbi:Hypothetical predicted protein [Mytilus galloprovincialis]|uniref:DUF5641 domain-containing protein n=1 Tax=Mytilus galloprovincialis TaxID=29158 RepID=A0A8B6EF50_MYTGA|nr:Hypothetical predicted protein [Mytilus galloprovincialis]
MELVWKFNAPHSSHMAGSLERMIEVTRRILDPTLRNVNRLTHEVLCTFMSEVCAIVNAKPIVAVSTDPEAPTVLSPPSLITQKTNTNYECFSHIDMREMYRSQWKLVQILANDFWTKWKQQYLQNQQARSKWCEERNNLKQGDIVLLKDIDLVRNQWSVGVILETFPSEDGRIRKVSVRITKNNNSCTYTRPIKELVYLLSP